MEMEDAGHDAWREKPPKPRKSRSSNSISASAAAAATADSDATITALPSSSASENAADPEVAAVPSPKKKKKSTSLNGTPNPDLDSGSVPVMASAASESVGLERKKLRRKKSSASQSPSLIEEEDSSPATSGGSSPVTTKTSLLSRRKSMDKIREAKELDDRAERKLQRRLSRDSLPSSSSSSRRSAAEETPPSVSPPASPRDRGTTVETGMAALSITTTSVPQSVPSPRRRKDSVDYYAPSSPHPLRNSFTQDDIPPDFIGTGQASTLGAEVIRPLPKKNSLSNIQEIPSEEEVNRPKSEESLTTVAKLKLTGALIARRQSLPANRRRTPSLEKSDQGPNDPAAVNRLRSQSLEIPGLVVPLTHLQPTLNETREEKLDRLSRFLPQADRYSLTHFLDEVAGDVEEAVELFLQKSLFLVGADGSVRRLNFESGGEESANESPSISPMRRSRLSRMMGGISSNLSPTRSLRALFDRDSKSLVTLFEKEEDKGGEKADKRRSVLAETEALNPHDRGIEDLLKLLDREEDGPSSSSASGSRVGSPAPQPPSPQKKRPRNLSFSMTPKEEQTMKKSSSTPFAHPFHGSAPIPNVATFKERRIYSSDSLPTAISRRVFLSNVPLVTPDQQKMNYNSDGHLGTSLLKESHSISQDLHKLVHSQVSLNQRKRLYFAIETLTTECVYVQVLEVLACVFVKPLYQAIVDQCPIISLYEMQAIFSPLVDTPKHHLRFYTQLQHRLQDWSDKSLIGDVFVEHINKLASYKVFVGNLSAAKNMILRCLLSNAKFEEFLEDAMKDPLCNNTPLRELLDAPLQRIPRYKMLLRDLLGCTENTHPDFQKLAAAYNNIKILDEAMCTLKIKEENLKRLTAALQSIQDCPPMMLASPRSLVDEVTVGELNANGTTKRILKLVLLSDALLIAPRQGSGSRKSPAVAKTPKSGAEESPFKFEALFPLSSLFIMETPDKATECSFHLWVSEAPVIYQTQNDEQRTRWVNNLRALISRTPLQPETQSQLSRHFSQKSSSRLSFSLKRRSTSLTSSQSPTGKERLSVTSFDSLLKSSSSKASLREEKLEDVLRDPLGLEKFTLFLQGEFSDENISFWKECEAYKKSQPGEFHDPALSIMETFIINGAPCELNIKYKFRENLLERVARNEFDDTLFVEVQEDIFALMLTDSFPRFLKSEFYTDYCRERNVDR